MEVFDHLLRPWWLLALPATIILALVLKQRGTTLGAWDKVVEPALMAAMDRLGRVSRGAHRRVWLSPLIAGLIALALVGPSQERRDGIAFRNLDGIVIAVDLSKSMTEDGRLPDALTAARLIARRAGSRQVALVVYAGDAYIASAFTSDAKALGQTIALLDGETVPDAGSRPERALALAWQLIADAEITFGDIVLVSDGGGLGPEAGAEAERLTAAGAPLSTLFVPTDRSDRTALEMLAGLGGGVAGDLLDPMPVAEAMDQGLRRRLAQTDYAALLRVDYGRYLLLLALLPALALFRRTA